MLNSVRRKMHDKLIRAMRQAVAEELDQATDRVLAELRNIEIRDRRDLFAAGEREAVVTSSRFARKHMPTVPTFPNPQETLKYALTLAPVHGLALEFGVYTGSTLRTIAEARGGKGVYGFDSFEGLPEVWRSGFPSGAFGTDNIPDVPGAELVVGRFEQTLPDFMDLHAEPVTFLHIDSDLYSSAVTVLAHVGPQLAPGSIIVFDEYFNYPGWEYGEYQAWQEYYRDTGTSFRFEGYTLDNEQVIVRIVGSDSE